MLWFAVAAMTVLASLGALWPLALRRQGRGGEAASEAAFYKAQLGEISRDVERGLLPEAEAAGARAETGRRLIAASAAASVDAAPARSRAARRVAAAAIVVAAPLIALPLYLALGRPDLPDAPLAERNAALRGRDTIESAIARIERHLAAAPDDGRGWALVAPVYMRVGRYDDAVNAFARALRLNGEDALLRLGYGEALVGAAGGVVTADARAAFDKALAEKPGLPAARFYLGLAAEQDGDKAKAIALYQALLDGAPPEAPWTATLKTRIDALSNGAVPAAPADEAQQTAIRGMVEGLAARLAERGGSAADWARLIRAYSALQQPDKAKAALDSARKSLAGDAEANRNLDALARELGLGG
jgi:cytochrome c-type biogenesis protein CcmH